MEEFIYYNNLFDIYGILLTEKEQSTFIDYYQENLSLGEIADNNSVSRSAVGKTIKTVTEKLNYYENTLHLYEKNTKLEDLLNINDINTIHTKIKEILND